MRNLIILICEILIIFMLGVRFMNGGWYVSHTLGFPLSIILVVLFIAVFVPYIHKLWVGTGVTIGYIQDKYHESSGYGTAMRYVLLFVITFILLAAVLASFRISTY